MAVSVASYQRQSDRQQKEVEDSPIDLLLKGLSIAGQVTGIYSNVQQARAYKAGMDEKAAAAAKAAEVETRGAAGKMTENEYQQTLGEGKFTEIQQPEGEELPTSVLRRTVIGPEGKERPILLRQTGAATFDAAEAARKSALQQKALEAAQDAAAKGKQQSFKDVTDLRKEYSSNPVTKDTQNITASWERVQGGFQEPSAAGDLNLIFGYMKMLDPGSTVREGEFANAQNSASVPEAIRARFNRIQSGERLTPDQRKDFFKQAENVVKGQFKIQDRIDNEYRRLAKQNNFDEKQLIFVQKPSTFQAPKEGQGQIKKKAVKSAADLPPL